MENEEKVPQMEEGNAFTRKKRSVPKVFLAVGVLALLIGGGCFGVFYYNRNKVELDTNGKIDIYSLRGASTRAEIPELYNTFSASEGEPCSREEYLPMLKREIESAHTAFVYGTAKNVKSITLEDHVQFKRKVQAHLEDGSSRIVEQEYDYPVMWWIVTFDIDVIDDLGTLDGRETVHVVMASRYATATGKGDDPFFKLHCPLDVKKVLADIERNPTGLFMLRNQVRQEDERLDDTWISNGNIWEIKGKEYHATEFADYFVGTKYDCDGVKYRYNSSSDYYTIYLDEIRVQEE